MKHFPTIVALAFVAGAAVLPVQRGFTQMSVDRKAAAQPAQTHPYVGMWVTADGRIRHNLLPNGRYDEARGSRESAYQGRYEVRGKSYRLLGRHRLHRRRRVHRRGAASRRHDFVPEGVGVPLARNDGWHAARMSEATCGTMPQEEPGCRCAHPGYDLRPPHNTRLLSFTFSASRYTCPPISLNLALI
jgi:hypothetical protein